MQVTAAEVCRSFDARDWARTFVEYVNANPSIATDEETMATWFAAALMRGFDEFEHRQQSELCSRLMMTHTYVTLEVSKAAFEEIRDKLTAADYGHCFSGTGEGMVIDMTGIALVNPNQNLFEGPKQAKEYVHAS